MYSNKFSLYVKHKNTRLKIMSNLNDFNNFFNPEKFLNKVSVIFKN